MDGPTLFGSGNTGDYIWVNIGTEKKLFRGAARSPGHRFKTCWKFSPDDFNKL